MRWPVSPLAALRVVLACLRTHLSERLYSLFHGGLPKSVDVKETRESIAVGRRGTLPVLSLQREGWWQGFAVSTARDVFGVALAWPEI